jgi:putative nucleotidyltransferase with HDIG domain
MISTDVWMLQQEIVGMFSTLVEEKDIYIAGHSKRVAMYSAKIAEALGLSEDEQTFVYQSGLLHDVGKVLTPESILLKPHKFNHREYELIKRHSIDGERIVSSISAFMPYATIIRHHHERYDGNGYPDGLRGDEIPLLSAIISVADAFDAMTTNRIYKQRKNVLEAIEEIHKSSGTQFNPKIVLVIEKVFMGFSEFVNIAQAPESYSFQEERFAYHFKDPLTGVYSADYLNYFLQDNKETKRFQCCYFVQLHQMQAYNEHFGWKMGNEALREIALRMKVLFESSYIFRIFGDDFIVLNPLHVEIDEEETLRRVCIGLEPIEATLKHFGLKEETFKQWDSLEEQLVHYEN